MKPENLMFRPTGYGITVWDRNRVKFNDFAKVAFIGYHRQIQYYTHDLSDSAKTEIEDLATYGNLAVSATQPDAYALCLNTFNNKKNDKQNQKQTAAAPIRPV